MSTWSVRVQVDMRKGIDGSDLSSYSNSALNITGGYFRVDTLSAGTGTHNIKTDGISNFYRRLQLEDGGDLETNSSLSVTLINNNNLLYELEQVQATFIGRPVTVQFYEGITPYDVFIGFVEYIEENDTDLKIVCVPYLVWNDKNVLTKVFNDSEFDNLPTNTSGKVIPRVLGNVNYAKFYSTEKEGRKLTLQKGTLTYGEWLLDNTYLNSSADFSGAEAVTDFGYGLALIYTAEEDIAEGELIGSYLKIIDGAPNGKSYNIVWNDAPATLGSYRSIVVFISERIEGVTYNSISPDANNDIGFAAATGTRYVFEILTGLTKAIPSEQKISAFSPSAGEGFVDLYIYNTQTNSFETIARYTTDASTDVSVLGYPFVQVGSNIDGETTETSTTLTPLYVRMEPRHQDVTTNVLLYDFSLNENHTVLLDKNPNTYLEVIERGTDTQTVELNFDVVLDNPNIDYSKIEALFFNIKYYLDFPVPVSRSSQRLATITFSALDFDGSLFRMDFGSGVEDATRSFTVLLTPEEFPDTGPITVNLVVASYWNTSGETSDLYKPSNVTGTLLYDTVRMEKVEQAIKAGAARIRATFAWTALPGVSLDNTFRVYEVAFSTRTTTDIYNTEFFGPVAGEVDNFDNPVDTNIDVITKLAQEAGIDQSEIDTSQVVSSSRYQVGRQLTENIFLSKLLSGLAQITFIAIRQDPIASKVLDAVDFIQDGIDQATTAQLFDDSIIIADSISAKYTDTEKLYTTFTFKGEYNPASKEYDRTISISNTDQDSFPEFYEFVGETLTVNSLTLTDDTLMGQPVSLYTFDVDSVTALTAETKLYFYVIENGQSETSVPDTFVDNGGNNYTLTWVKDRDTAGSYTGFMQILDGNTRLWSTYVSGISNYSKAKQWWGTAHSNYLITLSTKQKTMDLPWFVTPNFWTPSSSDALEQFTEQFITWSTRKRVLTFRTQFRPDFFSIHPGSIIRVNDTVATYGSSLTCVVQSLTFDYSNAEILWEVLTFPTSIIDDPRAVIDEELDSGNDEIDEEQDTGADEIDEENYLQ